MNITAKDLNRWQKLANVITKNDPTYKDDILSIFLEKYITKGTNKELNDDYVFISLKNTYLNELEKAKNRVKYESLAVDREAENKNDGTEEIKFRAEVEKEQELKLKLMFKYTSELPELDRKLFNAHYIDKLSQREISRQTGIQLTTVNKKVNLIKNKICQQVQTHFTL